MRTTSMKRRKWSALLSVLIVVCMLLGQLPLLASAAEEITLTYIGGVAEDGVHRYRLFFTGLTDNSDRYWNNNTVYVDGEAKSGEGVNYVPAAVYGGTPGELWLCLDYGMVQSGANSASQIGKHVMQIKAGTQLSGGAFTLANDIWVQFQADAITLLTPITLTLEAGGGAQDFASRYLMHFSGIVDTADRYWDGNTVYVDGVAQSGDGVNYTTTVEAGKLTLCLSYSKVQSGATAAEAIGAHKLEFKAGTILGGQYVLAETTVIQIDGENFSQVAAEKEPDLTVDLLNDPSRNTASSNGGLYFFVEPADSLASDLSWAVRYAMADGGIYVNGTLVEGARLIKLLSNLYYVAFDNTGYGPFKTGDVVTIDGTATSDNYKVKFNAQSFEYNAAGGWDIYVPKTSVSVSGLGVHHGCQDNVGGGRYLASLVLSAPYGGSMNGTGLPLTVNGKTHTAEVFKEGDELALILYYADFPKGDEYTVTIPAGTDIEGAPLDADFTFYVHADGSVDTTPPSQPVLPDTFAFSNGAWQPDNARYGLAFSIEGKTSLSLESKSYAGVISIDGKAPEAALCFTDGSLLYVFVDASNGITEQGAHTIVLQEGAVIGDYTVGNAITLYTQVDSPVSTAPILPPVPSELTMSHIGGGMQADRFLVRVDLQPAMTSSSLFVTVQIDGVDTQVELFRLTDTGAVSGALLLPFTICAPNKEHTVTVPAGTTVDNATLAEDFTVYIHLDNSIDTNKPAGPVVLPEASETVDVLNDNRNITGDCTGGLYFAVSPADALAFDLENWSIRYAAAVGGIYLNDELTVVNILKITESLYYIPLSDFGITPKKGDVVTIDGEFGNADHVVKYNKQNFIYYGNGVWQLGTYIRDLREEPYVTQDISELVDGLSEITLLPLIDQKIGDAKQSTNIALKFRYKWNLKNEETLFGFSKVAGMWDEQSSGWQVWFRPQFGQIFLAHGASEWQTVISYDFTATTSTVEIGSVDVYEYVDGVKKNLYARKIFVKIDGEEVISYHDTNLKRTLGKTLYTFSKDPEETKLVSLTSKGVYLKEKEPTVYDLFDVSGKAVEDMIGVFSTQFANLPSSTNVGIKMNVDLHADLFEFKLSLSKLDPANYWDIDASGWQFWFRPGNEQLFIGYGVSEYGAVAHQRYPDSFELEIGERDVMLVKDGKETLYARRLYIKIDGKEVLTWDDKEMKRPLGSYGVYYISDSDLVTISTQKATAKLPLDIVQNGESVESSPFVDSATTVVVGQESYVSVTVKSDMSNKVTMNGLYLNDALLTAESVTEGKYLYKLENPAQGDKLRLELSVKTLTWDEPTRVFDFCDISGKKEVTVPLQTENRVGAMVDMENGQAGVNSGVQFGIHLPEEGYNQIQICALVDNRGLWGHSGMLIRVMNRRVEFCFTASSGYLTGFNNDIFTPGADLAMEMGIVKCYEECLYKYDRWYVKAGKIGGELEFVGWYDSPERGHYGGNFSSYGSDVGGAYRMYTLKEVYSLTDASDDADKALINTYKRINEMVKELQYDDMYVAYENVETAEKVARVSFYTKPGTKLAAFTVNGADVTSDVEIGADGAYIYTFRSFSRDTRFAYRIAEDATTYKVNASALDAKLHLTADVTDIPCGGDVVLSVTADKGYVPSLKINGKDVTEQLTLNAATGVWTYKLRAVRSDVKVEGTAVAKAYTVDLTATENGTVTFGGDYADGKLPAGGKLIITVTPNDGYLLGGVTVNGKTYPLTNGVLELPSVYTDGDAITVEPIFTKGALATIAKPLTWLWWVIGGAVVLLAAAVVLLIVFRKKKGVTKADD
ncbi:MAG: hypothetical protein IIX68_00920 [Clostridia bacterium]|nr:hypothetical protein [Clostridia bacterium]